MFFILHFLTSFPGVKDRSSGPDQGPTEEGSRNTPTTTRVTPTIGTREEASQRGPEVLAGVIPVIQLNTIAKTVLKDRVECPTETTCKEGGVTTTSSLHLQGQKETRKCAISMFQFYILVN